MLTTVERKKLFAEAQKYFNLRPGNDTASLTRAFGMPRYIEQARGMVKIVDPAWIAKNIVTIDVKTELPGFPLVPTARGMMPVKTLWVHMAMRAALILAWDEIVRLGLADDLRSFDGLWVQRHQLYNPANPLSIHTLAAAIDLDARWNGYNARPTMHPKILEIFESWGFCSGARWGNPNTGRRCDGMHLQWTKLVNEAHRKPWQDARYR